MGTCTCRDTHKFLQACVHTHGCILTDVCTYADAHGCMLRRVHTHNYQACQGPQSFRQTPSSLLSLSLCTTALLRASLRVPSLRGYLWLLPRTHLQDIVPTLTTFQTEPRGYFLGTCPVSAIHPLWEASPTPSGLCSFSASQGFPRTQSVQQRMEPMWRRDNLPTRPQAFF